ncbi:amino acid transporter [Alternaria alternata]|nr:amino acid transporter [Alternaria alternata]
MDDNVLKGPSHTTDTRNSIELANLDAVSEKNGTHGDEKDMERMGKIPELRVCSDKLFNCSYMCLQNRQRQFKFLSIFGFAVILGNTWEYSLMRHLDACRCLYWHVFRHAFLCGNGVDVSYSDADATEALGNQSDRAPTAGGQYHWVSELAPRKHQKFLSYLVGWLCVIGWQVGMASTAFAVTQQIQGLIALNMPSYVSHGWHGTLFSIAITICSIVFNTILVKKLPLMEGIALVLHIFGFFAFLVVLWVMGPRSDTKKTWTQFEDPSGWGNTGLATIVGILGPILTLGGADLAVHLAEEVKDAAWVSPRAMVATSVVNYSLAFIMTVTVFSTLGDDITVLLSTPLGQPWIQILLNATESLVATNIMTVVVCLLLLFCSVNQVTAASRQLWSFARDQGLPCSAWLSYV